MIYVERSASIVRHINAVVVNTIRFGSQQRVVTIANQSYRKTGAEVSYPGQLPALRPAVRRPEEPFQRQLVNIANHEIVSYIKRRRGIAEGRIDGIDLFP